MLVRTDKQQGDKEQWLLLHKHDDLAVDGWDPEDHPRSVVTGRTSLEVLADEQDATDERPDPVDDDALAALDDLGPSGEWDVFGRRLRVTNLDKVLFPPRSGGEPVTKRDLLRYVARTAHLAVPHLRGRALNLNRFPDGVDGQHFWHKELPSHAPDWLPRWDNPLAGSGRDHDLCGRRRACRAALGGELRRPRVAPVDVTDRRARAAGVRPGRPRPR